MDKSDAADSLHQQFTIPTNQHGKDSSSAAFSSPAAVFDIGLARESHLAELHALQALIGHKQHEFSVYSNARQLVEQQPTGERCLVFLGDNLFVARTREQALEILHRQIQAFQNDLKQLEEERAAVEERVQLMERLQITPEGLVDILEPVDEAKHAKKQPGGRRIAHAPSKKRKMVEPKNQREEAQSHESDGQMPQRPKGIPEQDYTKFVELVNSLELSASDEDERGGGEDGDGHSDEDMEEDEMEGMDQKEEGQLCKKGPEENEEEEDEEEEDEENGGSVDGKNRRVRFLQKPVKKNIEKAGTTTTKSILKNWNESSPIDETEVKKMEQRDQKNVVPVSKETLGDEVMERNLNRLVTAPTETVRSKVRERNGVPGREVRPMPNKRQMKKNRPMSRWKAHRMGMPGSDDGEEEGEDAV